ncbi:MAG TPA: helix-turn-helix domain-containing protein [Mucilaginibacter sp.]|nr:helix-turn-helix domain-containing protein [Mucilaginibacter sp.]
MSVEIITKEDLQEFRAQLLQDIKELIADKKIKKWIKTQEVLEMLDISDVTLQTLRSKGVIPFKKLGGICYYNVEELEKAMQNLSPR